MPGTIAGFRNKEEAVLSLWRAGHYTDFPLAQGKCQFPVIDDAAVAGYDIAPDNTDDRVYSQLFVSEVDRGEIQYGHFMVLKVEAADLQVGHTEDKTLHGRRPQSG